MNVDIDGWVEILPQEIVGKLAAIGATEWETGPDGEEYSYNTVWLQGIAHHFRVTSIRSARDRSIRGVKINSQEEK